MSSTSIVIGVTPTGQPVYYILPETSSATRMLQGMILGAPGCSRDGLLYDD